MDLIKRPKKVERGQKNYLTNEKYQDYAENQFKTIYDYLDEMSNVNNYSTKEIKVGTWIDGKPIYRKVIDLGMIINRTDNPITATIPGNYYDTIVKLDGHNYADTKQSNNIRWVDGTWMNLYYRLYNGVLTVQIDRAGPLAWYNRGVLLIIEYTKTTD